MRRGGPLQACRPRLPEVRPRHVEPARGLVDDAGVGHLGRAVAVDAQRRVVAPVGHAVALPVLAENPTGLLSLQA